MLVVMSQNILRDEVGITYVDAWRSSRKSLGVTAIVVVLVAAAYSGCLTHETSMLTQLAVGATVASAAWLLAIRFFKHPAESEMKLLLSKMVLRLRVR
jgi:hypothetical protein